MKKHNGFTLVELLVVIVVIGILAGIGIVSYGNISNRTKYIKIHTEARDFVKALRMYRVKNGRYPDTYNTIPSKYILKGTKISNKSDKKAIEQFEQNTGIHVPDNVLYYSNSESKTYNHITYIQPAIPETYANEKDRAVSISNVIKNSSRGYMYRLPLEIQDDKSPEKSIPAACHNPLSFTLRRTTTCIGCSEKLPIIQDYSLKYSSSIAKYSYYSAVNYECQGRTYRTGFLSIFSNQVGYSESREKIPPLYNLTETRMR